MKHLLKCQRCFDAALDSAEVRRIIYILAVTDSSQSDRISHRLQRVRVRVRAFVCACVNGCTLISFVWLDADVMVNAQRRVSANAKQVEDKLE